ncbi:MAG: hypothetical protein ACR2GU_03380 [Rubrobacteraceae bacterium]
MSEREDYKTARVLLLTMIQGWLDRDEKPHLNPNALEIQGEDFKRFGEEELQWNVSETCKLFKSLVTEGFLLPHPNEEEYLIELKDAISYAWVDDLTR